MTIEEWEQERLKRMQAHTAAYDRNPHGHGKGPDRGPRARVRVVCIETGQVFASLCDASEWAMGKRTGVPLLSRAIKRRHQAYGFGWRLADGPELPSPPPRRNKPVVDARGKHRYPSIAHVARAEGVCYETVRRAIHKGWRIGAKKRRYVFAA